jgi:anti-sigma factor RsiW
MTCRNRDVRELLPTHLERKLDEAARTNVELHLASCGDCRTELEILRLLAADAVPDPSDAFWAAMPGRIYREVQEQRQRERQRGLPFILDRFLRPRWVVSAAVVLLVASVAWFFTFPAPVKMADTGSPDSGASYEDVLDPGQIELAELGDRELQSLDAWASGELTALMGESTDLFTNGQDLTIDDKLVELNTQELERLSKKLDEYGEEG